MVSPVALIFTSTMPSAAFLPTVTRIGSPIKSLSLNLTPARSFRSSTKTADGKIIKLSNGKNGIGISLIDRTEAKGDVPVQFATQGIGGPSAGMMFSLAIYTQVADPDLRQGRHIAGTGTINQDGTVGDIGGIDKKVVAADKEGAEIFFAPNNPVSKEEKKANPKAKSNYETAKEAAKQIHSKMKIVPVKTLQDAIDYLKK